MSLAVHPTRVIPITAVTTLVKDSHLSIELSLTLSTSSAGFAILNVVGAGSRSGVRFVSVGFQWTLFYMRLLHIDKVCKWSQLITAQVGLHEWTSNGRYLTREQPSELAKRELKPALVTCGLPACTRRPYLERWVKLPDAVHACTYLVAWS